MLLYSIQVAMHHHYIATYVHGHILYMVCALQLISLHTCNTTFPNTRWPVPVMCLRVHTTTGGELTFNQPLMCKN